MKKIWKIILLLCMGTIPIATSLSVGIFFVQKQKQYHSKNNNAYIDRTNEIFNDISNYKNEDEKIKLKFLIKNVFSKKLKIFFIKIKQKTVVNYNDENEATGIINYDIDNNIAKATINESFTIKFVDYLGKWGADIRKWKFNDFIADKQLIDITVPIQKIEDLWCGEYYEYIFSNNPLTNEQFIKEYKGRHYYFIYDVTMSSKFYMQIKGDNEKRNFLKCNLVNLAKSFIEGLNIPNSNDIYNEQSILKYKQLHFNQYFSTLYDLYKANVMLKEINDKRNPYYEMLKNDINNYKFHSYNELENRLNTLIKTNNLILPSQYTIANRVQMLNEWLIKNKIVKENFQFSYEFYEQLYKILIAFFKNNEIYVKVKVNNSPLQIKLWDTNNFLNIFSQIPKDVQKNINTLKFVGEKILSLPIANNTNKNIIFQKDENDINIESIIQYRWNAVNKFVDILNFQQANGIIINTNKYLSELTNEYFFYDEEYILNKINMTIFGTEIFDSVNILSNETWKLYESIIDKNEFISFYKTNNLLLDDYMGTFYAIVTIDNLYYEDGTFGDFKNNFLSNMINKINSKNNNLLELKKIDQKGQFIIKLTTNKILV